jgi:hypothetical protein
MLRCSSTVAAAEGNPEKGRVSHAESMEHSVTSMRTPQGKHRHKDLMIKTLIELQ